MHSESQCCVILCLYTEGVIPDYKALDRFSDGINGRFEVARFLSVDVKYLGKSKSLDDSLEVDRKVMRV